ncbi:hypothetical protein ACIQI7_00040 [Kitasatospora sp. NPDC092039]|uniref:hypothetical protein n=1 Tax=Kitasatospora sp. NPDC092039 TaxID=3364086 RepID=UPI003817C60B
MIRLRTRLATVTAVLALGAGAVVAAAPAASAKSRCWEDIVTAMDYTGQAISVTNHGNLNGAWDLSGYAMSYLTTGSCAASPVIVDVEDAMNSLRRGQDELSWGDGESAGYKFRSAYASLEQASYTA